MLIKNCSQLPVNLLLQQKITELIFETCKIDDSFENEELLWHLNQHYEKKSAYLLMT